MAVSIPGVKHVILVLSGKGGVGKSTVSTKLALALKAEGFKVGLLDVDLCGPSVPYLLGLEGESIHQSSDGWVPVYTDKDQKLAVMSIGFLLKNRNNSVVWRGAKKTELIKQFLKDVYWQDIDYLIVDTPPGTSDEHITVMTELKDCSVGAVLVTTPQQVALDDVRKEISLCKKIGIKMIGLVENMSGYVCPHCKECTNIWSSGGGESLATHASIPFLGVIPVDPSGSKLSSSNTPADNVISSIAKNILSTHLVTVSS